MIGGGIALFPSIVVAAGFTAGGVAAGVHFFIRRKIDKIDPVQQVHWRLPFSPPPTAVRQQAFFLYYSP